MLSNLEQHMNHLDRITLDPEVMGGKPCDPYLEADDIPAALSYAGWRSQELEFPSVPQPHPNLPDDPHQG